MQLSLIILFIIVHYFCINVLSCELLFNFYFSYYRKEVKKSQSSVPCHNPAITRHNISTQVKIDTSMDLFDENTSSSSSIELFDVMACDVIILPSHAITFH